MSDVYTFSQPHDQIFEKLVDLYTDLYKHQGYGKMSVEMRFLKRGQKEVLISCGKEYRFTVDYTEDDARVAEKRSKKA